MFNKFPFYRILGLFTLFSMSLTACNAAPTLTAPELTPVPIATPTPTPRPTETPTVVPTATEIPDPTMPPGETGKDAEGTYVKMENGDIARKVEYKNSKGEILYEGWAVEKTQKGGIHLIDSPDKFLKENTANLIPSRLFISPDVLGIHTLQSLTHQNNLDQDVDVTTLAAAVFGELAIRHFHDDLSNIPISELTSFYKDLHNGSVRLPFVSSRGESVEGILGPDTGFITIVVPYDSLDPAKVHGVTEWLDPYHESRSSFRSTVLGVDKDGNMIGLIASKKPLNELPDKLIRALALFHAANIIKEEDQIIQEFTVMLQVFVKHADAMGDKKVPDIIITRNP